MSPVDPLDVPNCPTCLHLMEPAEVGGVVMWVCSQGCDLHLQLGRQ